MLLEAMLAWLPVVATRVSAIPEIVVDGETGLLAEAGDARRSRRASSPLLGDAALRAAPRRRTACARAREEFSVARMADRTLAVYERALAR